VCLRKAGVPFTDERLDFPAWGALKATGFGPLSQLPVLEVDGSQHCQSLPLSAYAAKLAGLYPGTPLAQLEADEIVATVDELWNKIGATAKDKPETREAYGEEVAPKYLHYLAKKLGDGPFFGGAAAPGWADLWVYQYAAFFGSGFFDHVKKDFIERHAPAVAAHAARVKASELYQKFGVPE
jgi:glutathione S-transferase